MIREQDDRTALLIGAGSLEKLRQAKVAVIGLGGVGGYALEALARAGIDHLTIVDFDRVQASNINRQIIATHATIGLSKTDIFRDRLLLINPELKLRIHPVFLEQRNLSECLEDIDYLVDAIDSVSSKVELLEYCLKQNIKVVSVFGAGRRLDPSKIICGDISKSSVCPLARAVRKALRERGINKGIRAIWSSEEALSSPDLPGQSGSTQAIGSISYMPGIMGLWAASELIRIIRSERISIPF